MKKKFTLPNQIGLILCLAFVIFATSFKSLEGTSADEPGVTIYMHPDFRHPQDLWESKTRLGKMNDEVSSIKVREGFIAVVYEHPDFRGCSYKLVGPTELVRLERFFCENGVNLNDKASSIRISRNNSNSKPGNYGLY